MRKLRPREAGPLCSSGCLPATTQHLPGGVWLGWRISPLSCQDTSTQWNTKPPPLEPVPTVPAVSSQQAVGGEGTLSTMPALPPLTFQPHTADNMSCQTLRLPQGAGVASQRPPPPLCMEISRHPFSIPAPSLGRSAPVLFLRDLMDQRCAPCFHMPCLPYHLRHSYFTDYKAEAQRVYGTHRCV